MAAVAPSSDRRDGLTHNMLNPRLIKTTIDDLSIEETKEIRKRRLAVPALTKLAKNGYYGSLVLVVRDAFITNELIRLDCHGLERSDYKKIGCKLSIVVWRGKDYHPPEDGDFYIDRGLFDDPESKMIYSDESSGETSNQQEYYSGDDDE